LECRSHISRLSCSRADVTAAASGRIAELAILALRVLTPPRVRLKSSSAFREGIVISMLESGCRLLTRHVLQRRCVFRHTRLYNLVTQPFLNLIIHNLLCKLTDNNFSYCGLFCDYARSDEFLKLKTENLSLI